MRLLNTKIVTKFAWRLIINYSLTRQNELERTTLSSCVYCYAFYLFIFHFLINIHWKTSALREKSHAKEIAVCIGKLLFMDDFFTPTIYNRLEINECGNFLEYSFKWMVTVYSPTQLWVFDVMSRELGWQTVYFAPTLFSFWNDPLEKLMHTHL